MKKQQSLAASILAVSMSLMNLTNAYAQDNGKIKMPLKPVENYDVQKGPSGMNGIPSAKEFLGEGGVGENFIPGLSNTLQAFQNGLEVGQKLVPMDQIDDNGKLIITGEPLNDEKYQIALQDGFNQPCKKYVADDKKNDFFCISYRTLEASMFLSQAFMDSLNKNEIPANTNEEKGKKLIVDLAKNQQQFHCETKVEELNGTDVSKLGVRQQLNLILGHAANCIEAFRKTAQVTEVNFQPDAMNYVITVHNCLKEGIATDNFSCRSTTLQP